jgi:branched-chain amino acid transport system permease protein
MIISGAMTAAAGCFYAQYFLFVDSGIAFGTWISIEALLTPIIGGAGTVFGPLVGALAVKALGEGAKLWTGDVPGLDLMIYGALLVIVIAFAPAGLVGTLVNARQRVARRLRAPRKRTAESVRG